MLVDLGIGGFEQPDPTLLQNSGTKILLVPATNIHAVIKSTATSLGNQEIEMKIKVDVCGFETVSLSAAPIDVFLDSLTISTNTQVKLDDVFITSDNLCPFTTYTIMDKNEKTGVYSPHDGSLAKIQGSTLFWQIQINSMPNFANRKFYLSAATAAQVTTGLKEINLSKCGAEKP